MNKRGILVLISIYLFLLLLNCLTPMAFGDDYLYSFIWQGKAMNVPLSEGAERISSWHDIFFSQLSHYLTWGGRTISHVLAQFFLWIGKNVFNFFNALAGVVLVIEIDCFIHRGRVKQLFDEPGKVCWIFFALWAFVPGFSPIFFWLTGACNYLWTCIILLLFLLPYIKAYYETTCDATKPAVFSIVMFFFGIVAGWTNENSICWIILVLTVFVLLYRKKNKPVQWMIGGLAGLIIGYALLMFAPGNVLRLYAEQNGTTWLDLATLKKQLYTLFSVILFQFFLWYFILRSFFILRKKELGRIIKKELFIVKVLCVLAFGMSAIMVFSPGFPPRSGFPGTVHLIIAAGILLRLQKEYGLDLIQLNAKKFLYFVGCVYFIMTATVTIYNFYKSHIEMETLLVKIRQAQQKSPGKILTVEAFRPASELEAHLSGFHVLGYELSENENEWTNVAFARYYGIRGIRMIKK